MTVRSRRTALVVGSMVVAITWSCSLFPSLDGLEGKGVDGGGMAEGGGASDGAADAPTDSPSGDAGVDALFPPCTGARFCANFDTVTKLPFGFDRDGPQDAGSVAFFGARSDTYTSAPRSFQVKTTATETRFLETTLGDIATASIRFALRVDQAPVTVSRARVMGVNCEEGGDAAQVRVNSSRAIELGTQGGAQVASTAVSAPVGGWLSIGLTVAKSGPNVTTTIDIGNRPTVTFDACVGPVKVRIGIIAVDGTDADVSFDDVAVDWTP